jgi:hypothetical protein
MEYPVRVLHMFKLFTEIANVFFIHHTQHTLNDTTAQTTCTEPTFLPSDPQKTFRCRKFTRCSHLKVDLLHWIPPCLRKRQNLGN